MKKHKEKNISGWWRENVMEPMDRLDRVENYVGSGTPDMNACFEGHEFWVENKCPALPKRASTPLFGSNHKLSIEQRNWMLNQINAGGKVFIFIHTDYYRILISGGYADRINEMTLHQLIGISLWYGINGGIGLRDSIISACEQQ